MGPAAPTATGGLGDDTLNGRAGADHLRGGSGLDWLIGGEDDDVLQGADGEDLLQGGGGRDQLSGGAGADVFLLQRKGDNGITTATRDVIADFVSGVDQLDLSALDAKQGGSNDAFAFIGTAAFTSIGQLRYRIAGVNVMVEGDTTGDGVADFAVMVNGVASLTAADFDP